MVARPLVCQSNSKVKHATLSSPTLSLVGPKLFSPIFLSLALNFWSALGAEKKKKKKKKKTTGKMTRRRGVEMKMMMMLMRGTRIMAATGENIWK